MRGWRASAAVGLLVTGLAGTALAVPSAAAAVGTASAVRQAPAAAPEPVLTELSVSPGAVAVRGLDLVPVTVSATFSDTVWGDPEMVLLQRTTTGAWDRSAPGELLALLTRGSGTGSAGTFTGTVRVPSSAHGTWRVALIGWPGPFGPAFDPRHSGLPDATLAVTGTHRPRMRYSVSPQPLPYPQTRTVARAVMSFDDTRKPIRGLTIGFGVDNSCAERLGPDAAVRTDRHGAASRRITVSGPWLACAWAPFPGSTSELSSPGWSVGGGVLQIGTVTSAAPARSSARRRTAVPVTGHVEALQVPAGSPVQLQRLVGRHWRTVNGAKVRTSGRFTISANPPVGVDHYRVAFPGSISYGPSTSRTFTITGS